MTKTTKHPDWALKHKRPGAELKCINGRYYLYEVKSVYDKTLKRAKKISLGILGSITEEKGFVPSEKRTLKMKSEKSTHDKPALIYEYGYSKWLMSVLENEGILADLKKYFPKEWQFIMMMVYCRSAYKSPLKNIPFYWEQSAMAQLLDWKEKLTDQKISDGLFALGAQQKSIHKFLRPKPNFNQKVKAMGTLALMHNTSMSSPEVYREYKSRGEIEQFFDHLKNTLDASSSHMQREESLNGWMFINHLSMKVIYKLSQILKTTLLNKKQKLSHKYSINDAIEHLKSIKRIQFTQNESILAEINKVTRTLLEKMSIDIT